MSMSHFPDFHNHEALYRYWLPVITAHAVRCSHFKDAMQDGFVKLAEAAGRYNGRGPFINFFGLSLMGLRAETRDRAQNPELSLEALAESDEARNRAAECEDGDGWMILLEDDERSLSPDHKLFELQNFFTGYTVDFDDLPGDGDMANPEPLYIIPPSMEELPGQPYATTEEDNDLLLEDSRPLRESHFDEDFEDAEDVILGIIAQEVVGDFTDEDEDPADIETVEREAGLMRPSSAKVQRDLEVFLARLDPYQRGFVKATLSGSGPQACKEAALAAIKQAQLNRRKATVHRNAIAALAREDLHAACQQWNFMPQLEAV